MPSKTELDAAQASFERAQADEAAARASVVDARAALSTDETNLSKASIKSPIDGIVLTRTVDPGNAVAASLQAVTLFTIAEDLTKMKLQVNVDEADVGMVEVGQDALFTVSAYPARRYPAKITRVAYGSTTTDNVVTYITYLEVENTDLSLRPGMTATATIKATERRDVLLVPNTALRFTPASHAMRGANAAAAKGGGIVSSLMPAGPPRRDQDGDRGHRQRGGAPGLGAARRRAGGRRDQARRQRRPDDRGHVGRAAARHAGHHRPAGRDGVLMALAQADPDAAALIRLRGVTRVYGEGQAALYALAGVDLDVAQGEFVAVMGPSGSGKSTVMNILGCLDTPTAGEYLFRDIHVERLSRDQRARLRRRYIGFVFQGFNLLARTSAQENVELPLLYRGERAATRHRAARETLASVGLAGWEHHTPAELSGGQQQRVAIARAIVTSPDGAARRRADRQSRHRARPRGDGPAGASSTRGPASPSSWSRTTPAWRRTPGG